MITTADSAKKQGPLTPARALRLFLSHGSPFVLSLVLMACVVGRATLGAFSWVDAAVVGGIFVIYPFFEWMIHVFILHLRPIRVLGFTFELYLSKKHKAHHEAPWDLPTTFIPWRTHIVSAAVVLVALALASAEVRPHLLTGFGTLWVCGLAYEWVHFVSHVPYRASTTWMRELQRLHRLHHFKSEKHWYGVATHVADRVLGTCPDPDAVEASPTCRSLEG